MTTISPNRKPSFIGQGLLIVLPALVLAGFGLLSLRQDRVMAELEAAGQARQLARELSEAVLPKALEIEGVFPDGWAPDASTELTPDTDPLLKLSRRDEPAAGCLINVSGGLVYPPPWRPPPEPQPLPLHTLSEAQLKLWNEAQTAVYSGQDPVASIDQVEIFLATSPPAALAALAHYQLGVLWQDLGDPPQALSHFETVRTRHRDAVSESGIPLRLLAAYRLIRDPAVEGNRASQMRDLLTEAVREAVGNPNMFSRSWLEAFPGMQDWVDLWQAHENGRALYARLPKENPAGPQTGAPPMQWLEMTNSGAWLSVPVAAGENVAVIAFPEASVRRLVERALAGISMPPYLDLAVDLAGKRLRSPSAVAPLLADSALNNNTPVPAPPPVRVSVYLANPQSLYARQRTRTRWFGALIGLSVAAVLTGFAAAWRAFHRQRQLVELKTNFVSSVSHELRAPIASVRLMAEELQDAGAANPRKNAEYHQFIVQECRRLSGLIENVLDFSRHEQGRKQYDFDSTDLAALVQDTARLMQTYAADKRLTIHARITGEPETVEADGRAVQQVLVNLIDNAIKHSPPEAEIEVGVEFQAQRVRLWVADHGEGIPPEEHERIFERFYRLGSELRRETPGVGLGLAIVKFVTEAHRGTVTVQSEVGRGSCFTVILPVKRQPHLA